MNATDPEARWMYQGWILGDNDHDLKVMRGYADAVPKGRLLVSDMWAEWAPISGMLAEAGVPYLYGVLQNFGGTLFMGMSIKALNDGAPENPAAVPSIFDTFSQRAGGAGIGAFPEGIDQNPAYFTYLFDAAWLAAPVPDMTAWWSRYALERYGSSSSSATAAWLELGSSVYGIDERKGATEGGFWREKAKGGLLSAPLLHDASDAPSHSWYNASSILKAWRHLVAAAEELPSGRTSKTLLYDVVNVGRELLDKVANGRATVLANATCAQAAIAAGNRLIDVQNDADALLCTDPSFAMSSWVGAAAALGKTTGGAWGGLSVFYNRMARAQVTTWLPACQNASDFSSGVCSVHRSDTDKPPLEDYANKAWGGLVKYYYAGRVRCYISQWSSESMGATTINVTAYHACVDRLAWEFQNDFDATRFPLCKAPEGDALAIAAALLQKYQQEAVALPTLSPSSRGDELIV